MCHDIQEFGSQCWPLARIIKTHPGKDGKVRVVTIRMKGRYLQRPVNKLVLLVKMERPHPFSDDSGSQEANIGIRPLTTTFSPTVAYTQSQSPD